MGINQPSSSLKWLKYDPKDYADIFPYAEAFEEIRRKLDRIFLFISYESELGQRFLKFRKMENEFMW